MSKLFIELDRKFNHILIHTGQHYDKILSDVFFEELNIRKPDYNLRIGSNNNKHYQQISFLAVRFIKLLKLKKINPDLIIFLGDSNSVALSFFLKKEGYKIGHIEAGMRSYDKRMFEEINRTICDHCSDFLFVYHKDYKKNLELENIRKNVYVVGNTIVEPYKYLSNKIKINKVKKFILVDIHRPENFLHSKRLINLIKYLNICKNIFKCEIIFLKFKRTMKEIKKIKTNTKFVNFIELQSYKNFIRLQKESFFIISDSGTAQEEPALFFKPVIVPRDFSERPQSYNNNCSFKLNINNTNLSWKKSIQWIKNHKNGKIRMNNNWLGKGDTSKRIINILKQIL
jgi:UDP-N-acetylglucosamine 2-epimerase (non-hydrolysing)